MSAWIPDCGEVVWLEFDPQTGREQAGHRPAVVLSPAAYNDKASMMLCCPVTTKVKGYPFEVLISGKIKSVVLCDQVRSLDWRARNAKHKSNLLPSELEAIRKRVRILVG